MGGIGEEEQDDLSAVPEEGRRLMIGTVGKEERPLAALTAPSAKKFMSYN
jgi:hypothetical protein